MDSPHENPLAVIRKLERVVAEDLERTRREAQDRIGKARRDGAALADSTRAAAEREADERRRRALARAELEADAILSRARERASRMAEQTDIYLEPAADRIVEFVLPVVEEA